MTVTVTLSAVPPEDVGLRYSAAVENSAIPAAVKLIAVPALSFNVTKFVASLEACSVIVALPNVPVTCTDPAKPCMFCTLIGVDVSAVL